MLPALSNASILATWMTLSDFSHLGHNTQHSPKSAENSPAVPETHIETAPLACFGHRFDSGEEKKNLYLYVYLCTYKCWIQSSYIRKQDLGRKGETDASILWRSRGWRRTSGHGVIASYTLWSVEWSKLFFLFMKWPVFAFGRTKERKSPLEYPLHQALPLWAC